MHLKSLDILVLILSAAVVASSAVLVYGKGNSELTVAISGKGGEWIYPLNTDREVSVPGPLGVTEVEIKDGTAAIVDSPCPNKTCVAAGRISKPAQWVACLPNGVFVRIDGKGKEAGADAGTY
jgi:hypothetical protein